MLPSIASARYHGFIAGCNAVPFLAAYRSFRAEHGRFPRRIGAVLLTTWREGRECWTNAMRRAA